MAGISRSIRNFKLMEARSAKLIGVRKFNVDNFKLPKLESTQVLLEVISCGICSSEIPVYTGQAIGTPGVSFRYKNYPADIGHEVVGKVIKKGSDVHSLDIGSIVTGLTYSGCGFSSHFIEDSTVLAPLPKEISEASYKYALGEPMMATVNILNYMNTDFGDTVAIIGDGFMSLLLISALNYFPLKNLIVVGHHLDRLDLARKYGASLCINAKQEDAWNRINELTLGEGVDISVEYAGNANSLRLSASICKAKQQAKLVLAAAYDNELPFTIGNYLQNRAPVIIPAYPNHSPNKMNDLVRGLWAYSKGVFPMEELVTHEYLLDNISLGLEDCINRKEGFIKGIVIPN